MADVFLSYARGDRLVAERLADAITASGRTVWWDRHIKGGAEFSRDIERQLSEARHVLVLWSKEAVESRWVRDEASEAAESSRLVAATIDGTPPPLGFRQFHTIDLTDWTRKGATIPSELAHALEVDPSSEHPVSGQVEPKRRRRWITAIAAALILSIAALAITRFGAVSDILAPKHDSITLAILPFEVGGGDDLDFLSSGLSGALTNGLSQLQGLNLISSGSSRAVAEENLTATQVGTKLNASHLVEGEISPVGEMLRISVRLVDGGSGAQLWSQSYDGLERDLGRLEHAIGKDLAAALQTRLGVGQGMIANRSGIDPRAYEAYLKGLERVSTRFDEEARKDAVRQFQLAASIDPDFADAYAGLAYILSLSVPPQIGMTAEEIRMLQQRAADRALSLDSDNLLALTARSNAHVNFTGDAIKGEAIARQVLKRAPDFGPAHYILAGHLALAGRHREALPHYDLAVDSDPYNQTLRFMRMTNYALLGDYESVRRSALECKGECWQFAGEWLRTLVDVGTVEQYERDFPLILEKFGSSLPSEAVREMKQIVPALIGGRPFSIAPAKEGDRGYDFAAVLARGGRLDDAFRVARETAKRSQADEVLMILTDGRGSFPPEVRADPRYHALFRDYPHLRRIAAVRRKNNVLGGLPIEPSQLEAEKRRLADARR